MIDLKDVVVPPLPNKSIYLTRFRGREPGVAGTTVLRFGFSWTLSKPTATHFHGKDVVIVYLGSGDVSSRRWMVRPL
jgi:hypothetical protein